MKTMKTTQRLVHRAKHGLGALLVSAVLVCSSRELLSQEPQPPQPPQPAPAEEDPKQRMIRLFGEVQKHMDEIDRLLLEASSKRSAEEISTAVRKMEELLRQTEQNQSSTIQKIEEIIRTAPQQQGGGKGKSKQPQPPQDQDQPKGEQKPQDPGEQGQRDQRSDRPQQLDGSQSDRPQGREPGPEREPGGKQPESNRASDEEGRNQEGPDAARKQGAPRDDPRGNWEVQLPRKQTEVFRNPLRDTQIPDRYHRWIERWRTRPAGGERRNG